MSKLQSEPTTPSKAQSPAAANDGNAKAHVKSPRALKTISEVADILQVPQHVLRFWETKFPQIKPMKRNGGRRYYRPEDVDTLKQIKDLLYRQGFTIKGARKAFDKKVAKPGEADAAVNDDLQVQASASAPSGQRLISPEKRGELSGIKQQLLEAQKLLNARTKR